MFKNYKDKEKRKRYLLRWRKKNKERQSQWHKDWVAKNTERYKSYKDDWYKGKSEYLRNRRMKIRDLVYEKYGNICKCCKETNRLFLTIDHVNNDGHKERNGGGSSDRTHRQIIVENFPKRFQLLCYNCNCGRARNGGKCPHKT